ncbi:MAG: hypothetical protein KatS3mg017_0901 [Fimbriimonadales bacterium]|nr:MAG: hypothetical protein KatS3mg017_0901 [Fimbriimonadales bacterium]
MSRSATGSTLALPTNTDTHFATSRGAIMYKAEFRYHNELITLIAQPDGKGWKITLPDGAQYAIEHAEAQEHILTLRTATGFVRVAFLQTPQGVEIHESRGVSIGSSGRRRTRRSSTQHSSAEGILTAPMPGLVTKVFVQQGDPVEAGSATAHPRGDEDRAVVAGGRLRASCASCTCTRGRTGAGGYRAD